MDCWPQYKEDTPVSVLFMGFSSQCNLNRYLGQILITRKSLAKVLSVLTEQGFHWGIKSLFVWGAFVFSSQYPKDTEELTKDAMELEVFPACFELIPSLFQRNASVARAGKKKPVLAAIIFCSYVKRKPVLSHHLQLAEESRVLWG